MLYTGKLEALSLGGACWERAFSDPLRFSSTQVCEEGGPITQALCSQVCLAVTELRTVLLPVRSNTLDW